MAAGVAGMVNRPSPIRTRMPHLGVRRGPRRHRSSQPRRLRPQVPNGTASPRRAPPPGSRQSMDRVPGRVLHRSVEQSAVGRHPRVRRRGEQPRSLNRDPGDRYNQHHGDHHCVAGVPGIRPCGRRLQHVGSGTGADPPHPLVREERVDPHVSNHCRGVRGWRIVRGCPRRSRVRADRRPARGLTLGRRMR
jgi:hypothetical protein